VLMGVGWGNYAYTTRLKDLQCTSIVIKIKFYKTKKEFPTSFL